MPSKSLAFDPQAQQVSFTAADGITTVHARISDIDAWNIYNVSASISFGVQVGAFGVMLIMTAVLTKKAKRRTPVHILNLLSLFLGFFRGLFQALYFISDWDKFVAFFSEDYSRITTPNYLLSILSIITPFVFALTVTCSLVLQAHTVTKLMSRKWHLLTTVSSILVLTLALAFRLANTILNCKAVINAESYFHFRWLQTSVLATETMTIWFFSLIFTGKLIYTVWARKNLGLDSWSYLQILSIMGASTMIIPSIFAIVDYIDLPTFPSIDTWPLTTVALLLPLSTLWASMAVNESASTSGISKLWSGQSQTICTNCGCNPLVSQANPVEYKINSRETKDSYGSSTHLPSSFTKTSAGRRS
ncbi:hypothetical protein K3495_g1726 [Podosphaera aphanis]|nr:hypothetical protein K3495_g1726 [Podosphaera aphanis]